MNTTSPGSIIISGVAVLQCPQAVDPQKGPRNVIFDTNFFVVDGSQMVTMALLHYFASNEMASQIQTMADKPFQKAFVVASAHPLFFPFHTTANTQIDFILQLKHYRKFHVRISSL